MHFPKLRNRLKIKLAKAPLDLRKSRLHSQRGVAMLLALTTMTILGILVAQMIYETEVYHRIVFNNIDKLRSQYLAKSALRMALLQLHGANKAREKIKTLGQGMISEDTADMIWQTPIHLPPPLPPGSDGFVKEAINKFKDSLGLEGKITIQIEGDSDKLNINDLVFLGAEKTKSKDSSGRDVETVKTSEQLKEEQNKRRTAYREAVEQIIEERKKSDQKFEDNYRNVKAEELFQDLIAWMDPNAENDSSNRPKEEYYKSLPKPLAVKSAPLFSLSELYMVKGFDDEIARIFFDHFTAQITKGVNINKISNKLLRAFIPLLSDRDIEALDKKKEEGPFKDEEEFWRFLGQFGDFSESQKKLQEQGIKFTTKETAYRVTVTANSGQSDRTWTALVGEAFPEVKNNPGFANPQPNPQPNNPQNTNASNPPNVLYLKAE